MDKPVPEIDADLNDGAPQPLPSGPDVPRPRRVAPLNAPEGRYRSSMLRRFGLLYWVSTIGLLMRRVRIEEHSAENVRRAASRGPLVYVLHTRSVFDWLAVNRALNARRLPLPQFTTDIKSTRFRPIFGALREWWGALRSRLSGSAAEDPVTSGWLADAVADGMTTCVFLVRPGLVSGPDGGTDTRGVVRALLDAQDRGDQPVQAVPVVVVWRRAPEMLRDNVTRFLLGNEDEPSAMQKLWMIATGKGQAMVQAGQALDLAELDARYADAPPRTRERAARMLLGRYLYREAHVVRGPRIRPHRWMRRIVLESAEVRRLVREEAQATGKSASQIREKVERDFEKMAARLRYPMIRMADVVCRFVFGRIYTGVDLRPEDAERLRAAMRAGTPILVPCHRSHLDYLLISWIMFQHDLAVPHIVAGENLSFFPLGALFRRLGAFFIRRSFKGDRIFPVVFERYLRQLIHDGFPVEFFIEGGRSRTGKLLPPRLGVLQMILDAAWHERGDQEITMLPIAISHERIAEEKTYARELAGGEKKKEDLGQLVNAGRALRKRYGKVYLRVGEPLTASSVFDDAGGWKGLDRDHQREALHHTGERLMHRIAQSLVILPTTLTALGLMAQTRRGIRIGDLTARCHRLHKLVRSRGGTLASSIEQGGWAVHEALRRFEKAGLVRRLEDEEGDILQVLDEKRMTLEYYKNGLVHFVVPPALLASAVRGLVESGQPLTRENLLRLFRVQVFLLRYEFTLDPELAIHDLQESVLADLVAYGALSLADGSLADGADPGDGRPVVADRRLVGELAEVVRNFHESYLLVLLAARALRSRDISAADLPRRIQEWGEARLAVDELRRPEALSLVNIRNAVDAYREEGVLQLRTGGGGLQFDEVAWRQYTDDLRVLLMLPAE